jgi:hypothetical protein
MQRHNNTSHFVVSKAITDTMIKEKTLLGIEHGPLEPQSNMISTALSLMRHAMLTVRKMKNRMVYYKETVKC